MSIEEHQLQGFLWQNNSITYSKPYYFKVLERIGGGDGFASGLLHGILSQYPPHKMIEFATAAGVYAHTTCGDSPIATIDDIYMLMNNESVELDR
jgi:2-dehydro-3-deoxygluconokinase